MKYHFVFSLTVLAFATSLVAEEQPALRIGGSDLFDEAFREAIERFAETEDLAVDVRLEGSYAARTALAEGGLDLAILAVPAGGEEHLEGYESYGFAYQTVVFAIHPENTANELTLGQVSGIFGAEELVSYGRWGELGAGGELRPRAIATYSIAQGQSIAVDLFTHEVLRNPRLRGGVAYLNSVDELLAMVDESTAAIALLPRTPPPGSPVQTVALARDDGDIAFGPSAENVHNGDYPIRLPVYLVFPADAGDRVRELLLFLTGDEVAEIVRESGLMPLPGSARNRLRFDFEQL